MEHPLISIIVPAYNVEQYIGRCLNSLLNQTYPFLEIIVVDDGSSDGTTNIIKTYSEQYNHIIPLFQNNTGVSIARLNGVKLAKGQWIGFVDSDDEVEKDMYEFLLKNALKYQADISHCGYQMIFEDGRIHYFYNTHDKVIQNQLDGIKDLLEGTKVEPGLCNKLYKKELFQEIIKNNIGEGIKINEDLLINYYLFKYSNKSIFVDECKYHYIVRGESASHSKITENRIKDPIKVRKIIYDDVDEKLKGVAYTIYSRNLINIYNLIIVHNEKKLKKYQKEIYNEVKKININRIDNKAKILYTFIVLLPTFIYRRVYKIYVNYFQKNMYE